MSINLIDTLLSTVTVNCWTVQYVVLTAEQWSLTDFTQRFDALNLVLGGHAWIRLNDQEYHVGPGHVIFMTEDTRVNRSMDDAANEIEVLWIGFHVVSSEQTRLIDLLPPPPCLTGATAKQIRQLADIALQEWHSERLGRELVINGLFLQMLALAYRAQKVDILSPSCVEFNNHLDNGLPGVQLEHVRQALQFITAHYQDPLTLEDIIARVCLHPSYFSRLFRNSVGMPPMKFLEQTRISAAVRLLLTTKLPVNSIARAVGYTDPYYFSRAFHRVKGESPSMFRMKVSSVYPSHQ